MLLLFKKGEFLRTAMGSELSNMTTPNDIWIYSTKRDVWWHRLLSRNVIVPAEKVPHVYKALTLLLDLS